jgi:hypothetical protein
MISLLRKKFNDRFSIDIYQSLLTKLDGFFGYHIPFRVAESPLFIDNDLKNKLLSACNEISDVICAPNFNQEMEGAFFDHTWRTPNEDAHTTFLQMDFGIVLDQNGNPTPKLIEIQGFPSVYFFQELLSSQYKSHYDLDQNLSSYLDPAMTSEKYIKLLKDIIIGETNPAQVVMLEIEPEKQNTYIDFICTEHHLKLKVLCITKVLKEEGTSLFYLNEEGAKIKILKIYNRVIFDELINRNDLTLNFSFEDELDVKWIGHPNWFYKISKYTMPRLKGEYVPKCYFLNELEQYPENLEDYVLKPLFSFSGTGVVIDVTKDILDEIVNRDQYLLQEKVLYHPILQGPTEGVKAEIRMLMVWGENMEKPQIINNLVRLSKGKMIGVKFNKDKDWVGGSVGFFNH